MRLHRPRPSRQSSSTSAISRRGLLGVLLVAQLMVILDISAVNVALPDMASDLSISGGDIGWTITSYSLIFGSLLLLGGRAADLLGRRRLFLLGRAGVTLASPAPALAGRAVDHHDRIPGPRTHQGTRGVGRRRRRRRSHRSSPGRRPNRARLAR